MNSLKVYQFQEGPQTIVCCPEKDWAVASAPCQGGSFFQLTNPEHLAKAKELTQSHEPLEGEAATQAISLLQECCAA